jgi:phosphoglycolate phosphatase
MRTARPTVYLFDIDGTLITSGGAGRRAMRAAFADAHGEPGPRALDFAFAGMTDHAIVRTALTTLGVAIDAAAINAALDRYLVHLQGELARTEAYVVLPGVRAVLEWLPREPGSAIGLGTGNVKKGAYAKLARGTLDSSFAFGGFGCDHEDRVELLRTGATRGAAALGVPLADCRVVVIGDTPKDVAAAHGIGADCIGVGTGGFEPHALLELGAFKAFPTLEGDGVREALLTGP